MWLHQRIFGGEHSAHYYFRDFWVPIRMLAALAKGPPGEQSTLFERPRTTNAMNPP